MAEKPTVSQLDLEDDADAQLALLGITMKDLIAEIDFRQQKRVVAAHRAQRLAAKVNGERRFIRSGEVGGEVTMQVHPIFYHHWGQRLGYGCWRDPQFVREFQRDNPEVRVKSRSDKTTIVKPEMPRRSGPRGLRGRWAI